MNIFKQSLLLIFCIGLFSCSDEAAKARKDTEGAEVHVSEKDGQIAKPLLQSQAMEMDGKTAGRDAERSWEKAEQASGKVRESTQEEQREASRIISFSNQARDILNNGIYKTAEILRTNALYYRENWTLPKRPKLPAKYSTDPRLKARDGIFTEGEEKQLTMSLEEMDKALNGILSSYKKLENYINDSSIIDDGKKGLELSEKLLQSHILYANARKSYMEVLEAKAEKAEASLLYGHALQRQILAAKNIFAQMREIEELAAFKSNKREELKALRQNLSSIIEEAGKPPFQASPSLERLYRAFLKEAQKYCQILSRGIMEGFHNVQKRELKAAEIKCRNTYNEFVNAANKLAE